MGAITIAWAVRQIVFDLKVFKLSYTADVIGRLAANGVLRSTTV